MGTLNLQPPIGSRVTSPYGAPRKGRPHKGIDYHAHIGTAIVASETGKVVRAAFNSGDTERSLSLTTLPWQAKVRDISTRSMRTPLRWVCLQADTLKKGTRSV